ncbi:ABC transporter ATP-binding protein [Halobaculum rubrum]|uniref:ABC transporter ATP-binding protein n=1 Tax=Halobaculum rubrum TaxID=2872158 RepID=UPI001CECE71D|nr:ABC transporter ATP-binding protein [Halobaculum rubrum]
MGEGSGPAERSDPAVRVEDLRVEYGSTTALGGVDVTVEEGEFFTLVGPSGCGKTTTLRCLAGFEEPTAGSIHIAGESMAGVPPESRGIGVVFQNYALFPHMTVGENVAYGLRFSGPPEGTTREERVAELLELVDLPGFADRDPDTLSGGQQQRVALARALAPEPRLLLLDEPMSALDARLRERLRVQVRDIQRELGITTVYVTHDQEEALSVSDRVAVVDGGTVEQVGPPRELYDAPATRFVAEFLGDNNVFAGAVERVGGGAAGIEISERVTEATSAVAAGDNHLVLRVDGSDTLPLSATGGSTASAPDDGIEADLGGQFDDGGRFDAGERLVVCLRPERIRVRREDDGDPLGREDPTADPGRTRDADALLPATVESTEFLGDATRLNCDWNGVDVTVRTDGRRSFEAGEPVALGVDSADVRVVERL